MKPAKAVAAFSALAQESRFAVFQLLLGLENDTGLSAGDIASKIGVPSTTMSFHLSQLKTCGLIESSKNGRSIIYKVNHKKLKKLIAMLRGEKDENEALEKFNL